MAIEFKIDAEAEVIYSVFTGEFRSVDIQDHRNRFTADPLYHPNFSHLIDARSANLRLSGEEARILAAWAKLNRSNAKTVFVIDEESQGFTRMYIGWAPENRTLFHDMDSARKWLGLPPA